MREWLRFWKSEEEIRAKLRQCSGDKGERQRRESDWDFERVRKRFRLSYNSATVTRERGRDERVRKRLREGFRVRKRPRVIFERGLSVCSKRRRIGGKKEVERRRFKAKTRQPFEPCEPVMVHKTGWSDRGPDGFMLFSHGTVPYLKRTMKLNGSRVSRWDHIVRFEFNNLHVYYFI